MRRLWLPTVLASAALAQAAFVINLPLSAVDEDVTAADIQCRATFAGCGMEHPFYPDLVVGPEGFPLAYLIIFMDQGGLPPCLMPPWSSYPYVTSGELTVCDHVHSIGSEIQLFIMWEGELVLGEPFPPCEDTRLEVGAAMAQPLLAATPNPFNPITRLAFTTDVAGPARLTVHDLQGRELVVLLDGELGAGPHEARFDGSAMASGVYLAALASPRGLCSTKLLLMK